MNKFDEIDSVRSSLNYWMGKIGPNFDFVKFVVLIGKGTYLGILGNKSGTEDDCSLAPLFIRHCPWQLENEEDFNHKPWVAFLHGTDDSNYGKRFNARKDALKWAQNQDILDVEKEEMFWIN